MEWPQLTTSGLVVLHQAVLRLQHHVLNRVKQGKQSD